MAESAAERRARIDAANHQRDVEARRERQRQGATQRVSATRGNSDVDRRMGRTARRRG